MCNLHKTCSFINPSNCIEFNAVYGLPAISGDPIEGSGPLSSLDGTMEVENTEINTVWPSNGFRSPYPNPFADSFNEYRVAKWVSRGPALEEEADYILGVTQVEPPTPEPEVDE